MFDPRKNQHAQKFDRSWGPFTFAETAPKPSHENHVEFRPQRQVEDESGVCSPPLWKTSPTGSPGHSSRQYNHYRSLSPNSRAQAIARGQRELMEMVKNMPESSYELSLKDLVEHHRIKPNEEPRVVKGKKNTGNREGNKKIVRSGSIDNRGLFLKMVFPVSLGSSKKKKNKAAGNSYAKVSPRPEGSDRSSRSVDKEWWKKRFSVSSENDSSRKSSNGGSTSSSMSSGSSSRRSSGSDSGRKRNSSSTSCWCRFRFRKSKSAA